MELLEFGEDFGPQVILETCRRDLLNWRRYNWWNRRVYLIKKCKEDKIEKFIKWKTVNYVDKIEKFNKWKTVNYVD